MDKKKSILNISVAITTKILLLVFSIVLKRLLIDYVGNDANGVYSLYTSIIGFMAITELGVGTAITFAMYKPIVEGNNEKVSALYYLLRKIYLIVGLVIFIVGLLIMPLLPIFAKGYNNSFNLYLTFGIMLVSVVAEYLFSCKISLINAYKNNYITTLIGAIASFIRKTIQLFVLIFFRSFELYLCAKIISVIIMWFLTELYVQKHYKNIINTKAKVDKDTQKSVIKHTKALFMHKIGTILINATDNIVISAVIGVIALGKYSNYLIIVTTMTSLLAMFFTPLTSIIGHLCTEGDIQKEKKYFKFMHYFNFIIGIIFYLGYYGVINDIIGLFFGENLAYEDSDKFVPIVITINYFIQYLRNSVLLFRDATGSFYYDKWKPILDGLINLVLSIVFAFWFGVVGVIVATIITNIFVSHIIEPYILYKYGFNGDSPKKYYLLNYVFILLFITCLFFLDFCMQKNSNMVVELIINGLIAVAISFIPILILIIRNKIFRQNIKKAISRLKILIKDKKSVKINDNNEND